MGYPKYACIPARNAASASASLPFINRVSDFPFPPAMLFTIDMDKVLSFVFGVFISLLLFDDRPLKRCLGRQWRN
jgi:hypothetical protein